MPCAGSKPGYPTRQRDCDDLSREVGGLYPTEAIERDQQGRLEFRQGAGHDLDIEHGHEHADAHRDKPNPYTQGGSLVANRRSARWHDPGFRHLLRSHCDGGAAAAKTAGLAAHLRPSAAQLAMYLTLQPEARGRETGTG